MYAQSMREGRRVPGFFWANVARPKTVRVTAARAHDLLCVIAAYMHA